MEPVETEKGRRTGTEEMPTQEVKQERPANEEMEEGKEDISDA